jgi:hypothetical protein
MMGTLLAMMMAAKMAVPLVVMKVGQRDCKMVDLSVHTMVDKMVLKRENC